jgi:enterochelin esterase-like enzyme
MKTEKFKYLRGIVVLIALMLSIQVKTQPASTPRIVSNEVHPDRTVTFRISAPDAARVKFVSSDINNKTMGDKATMKKDDRGVWETTVGPLDPGAYRYNFNIDGVSVVDPESSSISESNTHVCSIMVVPGSDYMDSRDIPRGAIAQITYYSKALGKFRRMHIYTPPGYEKNQKKYPILYLLHGFSDNDNAWPTVGRAGFILDNMLAAGKIKPMIVVMPALHTRTEMPRGTGVMQQAGQRGDEFTEDFLNDIMPYTENNYRILTDKSHRAMAGLSMGGMTTHRIAMSNLDKFSYIGLFSGSTINSNEIKDAVAFKKDVKALFMSCGDRENATGLKTSQDDLAKIGIKSTIFVQPNSDHEWRVWRASLIEFLPLLFNN